ncbi:MAG: DUF362 domain-containing protein [Lentisphaerota bacterium]
MRILPKPSRAVYPCQQVAGPMAWSFVSTVLAWPVAMLALKKAGHSLVERRFLVAMACSIAGLAGLGIGMVSSSDSAGAMAPPDARNVPIGTARGIHPGRVTWVYNPDATPWNGSTGYWWDDNGTDQAAVDDMLTRTLQALTGATNDPLAWDALFRSFNQYRGRGDIGYQATETIAVKINLNNHNASYGEADNQLDASPHMVLALLRQLVSKAGVPQNKIYVYDAVRLMPDKIYNKCHAEFPQVIFADRLGSNGRVAVQWTTPVIAYAATTWPDGSPCGSRIPKFVYDSKYIINMALLKCHGTAGVTLTAKNNYGSIDGREHWYIKARDRTMPIYNPLVDLLGQKNLGGKTMLFLIDALYGTDEVGGAPKRFQLQPFNNRWSASLFASQDPVAIDSVGVDFLSSEFPSSYLNNADNYLHEAARANNPPSGTVYDPEGDGIRLTSLGVHEHWNDNFHHQYTRNLGTGNGIELVYLAGNPFRMDGQWDTSSCVVASNGNQQLYAATLGSNLYVATQSTEGGSVDRFILVSTNPAGVFAAPKAKVGTVAHDIALGPYLAADSANGYLAWYNGGRSAISAQGATGQALEGQINLVQVFGRIPERIYLSLAPYGPADGGALWATGQVPAGNGDRDVTADEFLMLEIDRDGDGLADWWENLYFLSPTAGRAEDDLDSDGLDNLDEFIAGTDPANSNSWFRAPNLAFDQDRIILSWPSATGKTYRISRGHQLHEDFVEFSPEIPARPPSNTFTDLAPDGVSAAFYRLDVH